MNRPSRDCDPLVTGDPTAQAALTRRHGSGAIHRRPTGAAVETQMLDRHHWNNKRRSIPTAVCQPNGSFALLREQARPVMAIGSSCLPRALVPCNLNNGCGCAPPESGHATPSPLVRRMAIPDRFISQYSRATDGSWLHGEDLAQAEAGYRAARVALAQPGSTALRQPGPHTTARPTMVFQRLPGIRCRRRHLVRAEAIVVRDRSRSSPHRRAHQVGSGPAPEPPCRRFGAKADRWQGSATAPLHGVCCAEQDAGAALAGINGSR